MEFQETVPEQRDLPVLCVPTVETIQCMLASDYVVTNYVYATGV
jgi:hypothetical protein